MSSAGDPTANGMATASPAQTPAQPSTQVPPQPGSPHAPPPRPPRGRVLLILALAVAAVSCAAIFVRLAEAPGVVVAFYRMLLASLVMLPLTLRALRRTPLSGPNLRLTAAAGALLAVHFATWISSLSLTSVTASVTLVSTSPLWVALFAWLFLNKLPGLGVMVGALLAVAGAATIAFGDTGSGSAPLLGQALALLGAVAVAGYLLLGRLVQARGVSLAAYAGTAYLFAAAVLLPLPLIFGESYLGYPLGSFAWILLLALVPQLIGHTGINYAARHLDTTLVATATLIEPVGSGILALVLFRELPSAATLIGAVVLLVGVAITLRSAREN